MPIHLGAPIDEKLPGAEPMVIFTATYGLEILEVSPERRLAAGLPLPEETN